jgi:hypothetical protein
MDTLIIIGIVLFVAGVYLLAFCLCRAAKDGDRQMERWRKELIRKEREVQDYHYGGRQ